MKILPVAGITMVAMVCTLISPISLADVRFVTRSDITDVKIYTQGAVITRTARVTVDPGQSMIRFENLSNAIEPASILVSATGGFSILSVTHQFDYLGPDRKTVEMIRLEDSLQVLNRKREGMLNQIAVLQEEQQLLQANKSIGGANTGVKLEDLKSVAAYFRERMTEIKNMVLDLTIKEKKLKTEIDKLNSQLAVLNNKRNEPFSTILVHVSAPARVVSDFTLSYYTGNVSWSPSYDIKANDASGPVELVYKAMVTQQTGEDWNRVRVKISTGNPTLGATAPSLQPWYLNFYRPAVLQRMMGPAAVKKTEDAAEQGAVAADEKADYVSNYVTTMETRFSTEYEISIPYSILSDNQRYAVQIREFSLPATYSYMAIPKMDPDAFLVAAVTGWEGLDLQPGEGNIYYENSYIGQTQFNPVTENDTLRISLGRDKRIIVKREKVKDVAGNQFIGQHRTRTFTYKILVKNNRKESITLTLEDQLPIASDKDIEVKLIEATEGSVHPETGKVTWQLQIGAAQQIEKRLGFSVKYPKERQVGGL